MGRRIIVWLAAAALAGGAGTAQAQWQSEHTIETTLGDTTETFWLQIPAAYDPGVPCPLLIGWHQWGGHYTELPQATDFEEIANKRGWIAACHQGVSSTHWNNHATQSHVVDVIRWIAERYAVDDRRIYMVGSSMGGAAGMVFSNNHLDPGAPRIAAAASVSGIQDCERRFLEQGINNSMIAAFGGTPSEAPYEYHRNSAICFADSTASMHFNAQHLPLLLSFGRGQTDSIWRRHAEDLHTVLQGWADTVWLHESALPGHGWGGAEEELICDFLGGFALDPAPRSLSINADEEGWWHWADIRMRAPIESFARFVARADSAESRIAFTMVRNIASARVDLPASGVSCDTGRLRCRWAIRDGAPAELALRGVPQSPCLVLRDGETCEDWVYESGERTLRLWGEGEADYVIFLDPAAVVEGAGPKERDADRAAGLLPPATGRLRAWATPRGDLCWELAAAGELRWDSALAGELRWSIYDISGRLVAVAGGRQGPGRGSVAVPPSLADGCYLVRVSLGGDSRPLRDLKLCLLRY